MKTFVLKDNDTVEISDDEILFGIDGEVIKNSISGIEKVAMITTDQGPFYDDSALVITFDESVFVIPSEHRLCEKFLFDEISKKITIDFQAVIDASSCCENAEFILYGR